MPPGTTRSRRRGLAYGSGSQRLNRPLGVVARPDACRRARTRLLPLPSAGASSSQLRRDGARAGARGPVSRSDGRVDRVIPTVGERGCVHPGDRRARPARNVAGDACGRCPRPDRGARDDSRGHVAAAGGSRVGASSDPPRRNHAVQRVTCRWFPGRCRFSGPIGCASWQSRSCRSRRSSWPRWRRGRSSWSWTTSSAVIRCQDHSQLS